jgi:hypothetical protein
VVGTTAGRAFVVFGLDMFPEGASVGSSGSIVSSSGVATLIVLVKGFVEKYSQTTLDYHEYIPFNPSNR